MGEPRIVGIVDGKVLFDVPTVEGMVRVTSYRPGRFRPGNGSALREVPAFVVAILDSFEKKLRVELVTAYATAARQNVIVEILASGGGASSSCPRCDALLSADLTGVDNSCRECRAKISVKKVPSIFPKR